MIQIALNNKQAIIIRKSIFYVNHRRHPNLFIILKKSSQTVIALEDTNQLKELHEKIFKNIKYNWYRSKPNINKKRKKSQFKKKNKVYLLIKNLRILRANRKLNYKKVDLFYVKPKSIK